MNSTSSLKKQFLVHLTPESINFDVDLTLFLILAPPINWNSLHSLTNQYIVYLTSVPTSDNVFII